MARKFISFLGIGNYSNACYIPKDKSMGQYTSKFIQEALIKTVCRDWDSSDKAVIFITKEAEKINWYNEKDENKRLKVLLEDCQLGLKGISIPTGRNEEEIWEIFNIVINNIEEGDEIVLDITHALRYIPMLAIIILDYAKVVKNIKLLGIYYGAWDERDERDESTPPIAPIFDLTPLAEMQEWSQAVNTFIKYGNSAHLQQVSMTNLESRLSSEKWAQETRKFIDSVNNFTMNINTCRGQMVSGRKTNERSIQFSVNEVKKNLKNVKNLDESIQLKPLIPLMTKIEESIKPFDENNSLNTGLATVEWCINNHLIQQAYTALEETLKTYICELNDLDINKYEIREYIVNDAIGRAISILTNKEIKPKGNISADRKDIYEKMIEISDSLDPRFVNLANNVKQKRNDINHFGFSKDVAAYNTLETDIKKYYNEFLEIINKNPVDNIKVEASRDRKMYLVFSHKLTEKQIEDAKSNLDVEKFIYLPTKLQNIWSNISPCKEDTKDDLNELVVWIDENISKEDYILIQGDYGATYYLVEYCKSKGLKPIYSTTEREVIETITDNNTIVLSHKVSHIRYREY